MQLPDLSLLIALAVFWATYHVLKATVFKPLGEVLAEREKTVVAATTALQGAFDRQAQVLADVDRRLLDARREALAQRETVRAEAAARRQELLDAARAESRRA